MVSLLANFIPLVARPQPAFASKVSSLYRFYHRAAPPLMATHKNSGETSDATDVLYSPAVDNLQEFLHSNPSDGWERCWEEGLTPWDLGKPTPILQLLLQTDSLPKGRALIPGCGSGYDVVTLASSERYVVGLDLSEVAITKAKEIDDHDGGPPYKTSVADYEEVLHPQGFLAISIVENELAVNPRKGREKLGRWRKMTKVSPL